MIIKIDYKKCDICDSCLDRCPKEAILRRPVPRCITIDEEVCDLCSECISFCDKGAISIEGEKDATD